jgi:hypothetical protein
MHVRIVSGTSIGPSSAPGAAHETRWQRWVIIHATLQVRNAAFLRIFVRRFRCRLCYKTISILPSFAQPYRLVLNAVISEFFKGTLGTGSLSWLTLLKQYWNKFANWLPEIDGIMRSVVERSPPRPDATGWWAVIVEGFGGMDNPRCIEPV